jgi:hypothetical protein
LLRPGYAIALLLIAFPLGDLAVNVWPFRLGLVEWRFGTVGLLSGFVLTPLLGIVGLVVVATALEQQRVLRVVAIVNLVAAVATLVILVVFGLDWIQMRSGTAPEARHSMDVGAVKALLKHLLTAATLGWLGLVGWRGTRPRRSGRTRSQSPLIGTGPASS